MIRYFKFRRQILDPVPARDVYVKRGRGKGWPEECPPVRAANAFGFDLPANFDITFVRSGNRWRIKPDIEVASDFELAGGGVQTQQYAWFWERGQKLPHPITDNVYRVIRHQVKISSFLYIETDSNELLLVAPVPNLERPWRPVTALIDTDWYPANYPWHAVIELDPRHKKITIRKGEPLCRIIPLRRAAYFARPMTAGEFETFYERGQKWLAAHGRFGHGSAVADITRTYGRQRIGSKFVVTL